MSQEIATDIPLDLQPNPEGDNCFEVAIREGASRLTYFASTLENGGLVNAGDVELFFSNCVAARYVGAEPNGELYPGWNQLESDFCEIKNSQWAASFNNWIGNYHRKRSIILTLDIFDWMCVFSHTSASSLRMIHPCSR